MILLYKISNTNFKTIYAVNQEDTSDSYFFIDKEWVFNSDISDKFKKVLDDLEEVPGLYEMNLGDIITYEDKFHINCLGKFKSEGNLLDFLNLYTNLLNLND